MASETEINLIITILVALGSVALGGYITYWAARRYYERASEDLRQTTEDLRQEIALSRAVVNALGRHLHEQGVANLEYDSEGNITKIVPGTGAARSGTSAKGTLQTTYPEEQRSWWARLFSR